MTIGIIIFLVLALGVIMGYAARQMQEIREKDDKIETMRGENEALLSENEKLRQDKKDHEANLAMLITELDKTA